MNDKFTVNLGIRYEYELGQREQSNKMAVGFDPGITYTFPSAAAPIAHGGIAYAGVNGYPVHCCDLTKNRFSPRIGLAYSIRKTTVVRGGFGIFYAPVGVSAYNPGYTQASSYAPGNVSAALTAAQVGVGGYLSNPFSGGTNGSLLQPSGNTLGYLTSVGSSISVNDFRRRAPFVEQYSVDVQQQLPWATTLKVAYTGAHSEKFPLSVNINQLSDAQFAAFAANPVDQTTKVTNPYSVATISNGTTTYPTTGVVSTANATIAQGQLLLPYPQFLRRTVTLTKSEGYSLYNALAVNVPETCHQGSDSSLWLYVVLQLGQSLPAVGLRSTARMARPTTTT